MIDLDYYLDFITENKLTQQQFLMLLLLHRERYDLIQKYKDAFPTGDETMIGKTPKQQLIDDGWLIAINHPSLPQAGADNYKVAKKFTDVFVDEHEAGDEIWTMYPDLATAENGNVYPLTLMDINEFRETYWKRIKGVKKEHELVKLDLKYGIDKGMITMGIKKWVESEYWKVIRKKRLADKGTKEGTLTSGRRVL